MSHLLWAGSTRSATGAWLARLLEDTANRASSPRYVTGCSLACTQRGRGLPRYYPRGLLPGGSAMRRLLAAIAGLAATALLVAPALAHHSMSMFDTSKEILIKGTVARLDWKNPHIYLIVETVGEDGKRQLIQREGLAITQALVDGLHQKDLQIGRASC